jgi:hypothetical protein
LNRKIQRAALRRRIAHYFQELERAPSRCELCRRFGMSWHYLSTVIGMGDLNGAKLHNPFKSSFSTKNCERMGNPKCDRCGSRNVYVRIRRSAKRELVCRKCGHVSHLKG